MPICGANRRYSTVRGAGVAAAVATGDWAPAPKALFNLGFLEFYVTAGNRIVFLQREFFRRVPRILLGHIEVSGVGGAHQTDFDGSGLSHCPGP